MFSLRQNFETPAASASALLGRIGFAVLLLAIPLAGVASRQAIYVLFPIGAVLVIGAALIGQRRERLGQERLGHERLGFLRKTVLSRPVLASLALAAWAGLSLVWTAFLADAAAHYLKVLSTGLIVLLVIAYLPNRAKISHLYLLPIGVGLTALATLIGAAIGGEAFRGGPDVDSSLMQHSVLTSIILLWPSLAILSLRAHFGLAAGLAVAVAAATLAAFAQAALAALALGALTYTGAMSAPRRTARVLCLVVTPLILLAPILPLALSPLARLWQAAAGAGDLTSAILFWSDLVGYDAVRLVTGHGLDMGMRSTMAGYLPPSTPTTILFEIWFDLGAIGAIAFAVLAIESLLAAGRSAAGIAPALLAAIVSGLAIAIFGLATIQLWWITLSAVDILAFAILIKGFSRSKRLRVGAIEVIVPERPARDREDRT